MTKLSLISLLALTATATTAQAVTVNWADLTGQSTNQVNGTITVGPDSIGVTFDGAYSFAQTAGGTNYWTQGTPAPYTGGSVDNAPPASDIIALSQGGLKTITFSQAVTDPYLALVSWNGNTVSFGQPFEVISQGCGYWGCGTFTNVTPTGFVGSGELHGIIRFQGTFSSISFTDTSENWHGIQIGIAGLANPVPGIPEPTSWLMMIAGFGLVGTMARLQKKRAQTA